MLATFVGGMEGFKVVGEASDTATALGLVARLKPRVVVLDWMLVGGIGLDFLRALKDTGLPEVLVFSANTTDMAVREAIASGARGYIEKTASFPEFAAALRAVSTGNPYFGPVAAQAVRRIVLGADRAPAPGHLTARENDVLRLLAQGLSSREIAQRLDLSPRTVENHRASISRRTGLNSVAQLTLHAVKLGLIPNPVESSELVPAS